jgi:hypothetical protein
VGESTTAAVVVSTAEEDIPADTGFAMKWVPDCRAEDTYATPSEPFVLVTQRVK